MKVSRPTYSGLVTSDHLAVFFTITYGLRGREVPCAWSNMGDPDHEFPNLRMQTYHDLDVLAEHADVIGLCEVLDRIPFLVSWALKRGFKILVREHADVALLWRHSVRVTRKQAVELVPAQRVEDGPGGNHSVARWSMRIRLGWFPSAGNVYIGHMIAAANTGHRRSTVYTQHVSRWVRLVGPRRHAALVMDANQDPDSPRLHPIKQAGFVQLVNRKTHAHGIYDQVWVR